MPNRAELLVYPEFIEVVVMEGLCIEEMPLYKRKLFQLVEKPENLEAREDVFQIRFTKEIFRDYDEYLNRLNLYRKRVWACKVTGKGRLTYEEALVSEKHATDKIQLFPEQLMPPVLHQLQFSMLPLKDLVSKVATKLAHHLSEGDKLYGKRNNRVYPCKIVKVLHEEAETETMQYEVAWLDKDNKITGNSIVIEEDLVRKKLPFSRDVLKSIIKEYTYRSVPWVLRENLAKKHGISTDLPDDLKSKFVYQEGNVLGNKKQSPNEEASKEHKRCRSKKTENKPLEEPIKYPIDDLLVQPAADDPVFMERPSPSREFNVPMDCVGDLLMIWDFLCSFGRLLHLSPFSFEDFESALCCKDRSSALVVESHSVLLRFLIKDEGEYFAVLHEKKTKPKITISNWTQYLCDFLEFTKAPELSSHVRTIKRGHYGLLSIRDKLKIFRELVDLSLYTTIFREKLNEYIEQRRALKATLRGGASKRKRQDKDCLKGDLKGKETPEGLKVQIPKSSFKLSANGYTNQEIGDVTELSDDNALLPRKNHGLKNSKHACTEKPKIGKKQKANVEGIVGDKEDLTEKKVQKHTEEDSFHDTDKMSKEQRKEYVEREMEKRFIRTNPLGKDKDHNRYLYFRGDGRIYVENSDSSIWGYYDTKDELDALIGSLNSKGNRERALKEQLGKYYSRICLGIQKRSKMVAQHKAMEATDVRRSTRVQALPRENPAHAFRKYVNKWKQG